MCDMFWSSASIAYPTYYYIENILSAATLDIYTTWQQTSLICMWGTRYLHSYIQGWQEIGSCLIHFINEVLSETVTVIAYSDSCGGQNKNKNITKLFMLVVKVTKIHEIHHTFLEPGHAFMECDKYFGIIEKVQQKNLQVFIPEHWKKVIQ